MPIFEYVCASCGERFEKLILSGRRKRQLNCPSCGGLQIKKAISLFGVSGGNTTRGFAHTQAPRGFGESGEI